MLNIGLKDNYKKVLYRFVVLSCKLLGRIIPFTQIALTAFCICPCKYFMNCIELFPGESKCIMLNDFRPY